MKVLVQGIFISVISVHAPQYVLDGSQKKVFYDSLIIVFRKLEENEIVFITGGFNGHVRNNPENYEDHYGGHGCRVRNKEKG